MDFILDLLQGAGIAAAIGIRPFLPVLLAGALASADVGLDFSGTDFSFLEAWPFLLGALVLVVALDFVGAARGPGRRRSRSAALRRCGGGARAGRARGCGLGGRSLGRMVGGARRRRWHARRSASRPLARSSAACAAGSTTRRPRRCPSTRRAPRWLPPALSILFPPLALLVLGALAWLLTGGRRRAGEKYAGLRILR